MSNSTLESDTPTTPFFIVGTGRCGTTLLQVMLSSHNRLSIPPEVRFFGRMDPVREFSDPLEDSQVEAYALKCLQDLWWQNLGVDVEELANEIRGGLRSAKDIFLWVLRNLVPEQHLRIGEKSPPHAMHIDRILELFPDAKFIHIHRDPRDVVTSYLKQYWCTDKSGINVALYCRHCLSVLAKQTDKLGSDTIQTVCYEQLVQDPEPVLRRLCEFLGEEFDPAMLSFDKREQKGFLSFEAPWKGLTQQPLTSSRIGRFQGILEPRQVFFIEKVLEQQMADLGYQPTGVGQSRLDWNAWYWMRRVQRRIQRKMGLVKPLMDESRVQEKTKADLAKAEAQPVG